MQHSRIEHVVINSLGNCLVAIIVNQARTDGGGTLLRLVPHLYCSLVCLTFGIVSRLAAWTSRPLQSNFLIGLFRKQVVIKSNIIII